MSNTINAPDAEPAAAASGASVEAIVALPPRGGAGACAVFCCCCFCCSIMRSRTVNLSANVAGAAAGVLVGTELLPLPLLLAPSKGKLPNIVTGGAAGRTAGRKAALPTGTNFPTFLVTAETTGRPCNDDVPAAALNDANDDVAGRLAKDDDKNDDEDDDEDDDDEDEEDEKEENVDDAECGRAAATATGLLCISTSRWTSRAASSGSVAATAAAKLSAPTHVFSCFSASRDVSLAAGVRAPRPRLSKRSVCPIWSLSPAPPSAIAAHMAPVCTATAALPSPPPPDENEDEDEAAAEVQARAGTEA